MKIYIGADHNGFSLKEELETYLAKKGYEIEDEGDKVLDTDDDFPQFGAKVAVAVLGSDDADPRGILICGSGQGVCIAANRFRGIRATLAWNSAEARAARNDDNSNVLCLPARELTQAQAAEIVDTWLTTPFAAAPRFIRRLKELDELR